MEVLPLWEVQTRVEDTDWHPVYMSENLLLPLRSD